MAKGKTGPKGKYVVDKIKPEDVEKLAAMQNTTQQIADFFECSKDTIERNFAAQLSKGRAMGMMTCKRKHFENVQSGDMRAIEWFMKCYGGFTDKTETTGNQTLNVNIKEVTDILMEHKDLIKKVNQQ